MLTLLGWLLGLANGVRHALEPDHVAAISTLVAEQKNTKRAAAFAAMWGLGHARIRRSFAPRPSAAARGHRARFSRRGRFLGLHRVSRADCLKKIHSEAVSRGAQRFCSGSDHASDCVSAQLAGSPVAQRVS